MTTEVKSLRPLSEGTILIVGAKASNFDEEIKTNPRVTIWDSQNQSWSDKNIPTNVRAVFITKWISHADFNRILAEARKKHITVFNHEGTGMIARQVRELLDIQKLVPQIQETIVQPTTPVEKPVYPTSKLHVLMPFIDFNKKDTENAHILFEKAKEMGITTTLASLSVWSGKIRRNHGIPGAYKRKMGRALEPKFSKAIPRAATTKLDTSVEILDEMIKSLKDMRDFLIATTSENATLKAKLAKFRKMIED